jgi:hypothetical protein
VQTGQNAQLPIYLMTVFLQPFFVNVRSSSECSLSFLDRFSFWSGQCRHFRLRGTRITFPALLGNDFCVRPRRFGEPRCFVREALRSLTRSRIRFCWYFKCADSRILSNVSWMDFPVRVVLILVASAKFTSGRAFVV